MAAELLIFMAQAGDNLQFQPINTGTILGGIALLLTILFNGVNIFRGWRQDARTAKKEDIDVVIENYRLLLEESKTREGKLEQMVESQRKTIEANEVLITEQRQTISEQAETIKSLKMRVTKVEAKLTKYMRTNDAATA